MKPGGGWGGRWRNCSRQLISKQQHFSISFTLFLFNESVLCKPVCLFEEIFGDYLDDSGLNAIDEGLNAIEILRVLFSKFVKWLSILEHVEEITKMSVLSDEK